MSTSEIQEAYSDFARDFRYLESMLLDARDHPLRVPGTDTTGLRRTSHLVGECRNVAAPGCVQDASHIYLRSTL